MAVRGEPSDGDPFAAADKERNSNTPLGRMEQRALEEAHRLEHGTAQPVQSTPLPGKSAQRLSSVERNGQIIETLDLDDSDDELPHTDPHDGPTDSHDASRDQTVESPLEPLHEESHDEENATELEHTFDEGDHHNELDVTMNDPEEEEGSEEEEDEEDSEEDDDDEDETSINIDADVDLTSAATPVTTIVPPAQPSPQKATPGDIVLPDLSALPAIPSDPAAPVDPAVVKPISTRAPRVRSPSPPPPKPIVPAVTVRLEIALPPPGNADVPMYSVAELAKEAGYGLDPEEDKDDSASDGNGSGGEADESKKATPAPSTSAVPAPAPVAARTATGEVVPTPLTPAVPPPKKRQRKFIGRNDGYDVEDPFVDDSELALFEPKYYHRPKREGFFVAIGAVELISDTQPIGRPRVTAVKPKVKSEAELKAAASAAAARANSGSAVASTSAAKPRQTSAAFDEAGPTVSSVPAFGSGSLPSVKKKKLVGTFSPELQAEFDMLKREAAKESFVPRNKFPPRLKELLVSVAALAFRLDEYTDDFFAYIPSIFPYNGFTLKKLVKREFHSLHLQLIDEHQQELIELMRANVAESLPAQQADFDTAHAIWFANHTAAEAAKALAGDSANAGASTVERDEMEGVVMEGDKSTTGEAVAAPAVPAEPAEPKKRFKFSEDMRSWLFDVITMEDSKATITIEKYELDKVGSKPTSILAHRKSIYANLLRLWPEDWMSTNYLSREMSAAKKKYDRESSKVKAEAAA